MVAKGRLTKDGGDADAARLNPLEAGLLVNLLLRYYTARSVSYTHLTLPTIYSV